MVVVMGVNVLPKSGHWQTLGDAHTRGRLGGKCKLPSERVFSNKNAQTAFISRPPLYLPAAGYFYVLPGSVQRRRLRTPEQGGYLRSVDRPEGRAAGEEDLFNLQGGLLTISVW